MVDKNETKEVKENDIFTLIEKQKETEQKPPETESTKIPLSSMIEPEKVAELFVKLADKGLSGLTWLLLEKETKKQTKLKEIQKTEQEIKESSTELVEIVKDLKIDLKLFYKIMAGMIFLSSYEKNVSMVVSSYANKKKPEAPEQKPPETKEPKFVDIKPETEQKKPKLTKEVKENDIEKSKQDSNK